MSLDPESTNHNGRGVVYNKRYGKLSGNGENDGFLICSAGTYYEQ